MARVTVIGAGTMGHGIAHVSALAGHEVVLFDVSSDAVEEGLAKIRRNLEKGVSLGKVEEGVMEEALRHLKGEPSLSTAVRDADIVIEAVPEVADLKASVFAQIQEAAPPSALLATNTSSLSVTDLGATLDNPARFLGLHFFNPVHVMKLVEVVRGRATSDETLAEGVRFVGEIGKQPVVVKDSPGFASSRLGIVLGLEAMRMLEEGVAEASDIDTAMELGYRHPMGPLKLTDLVGLDVRLGIAEYLHETLQSEAFRPPAILKRMVAEGKLGKKSGQGFYDWSDS